MWEPVDVDTFGQCWTAECDELSQNPNRERFFLATGRLLPIWNLLGDDPEVRRLVTADGSALLGRIVPHGDVNTLLGKLGIAGAIKLAPAEIVAAARSEEHTSELQSLMRISYAVYCLKNIISYNN